MDNSTGFTSLESTPLDRQCFASEQERLDAYSRALRVPVQAGQNIKGDQGEEGPRGPTGLRGAKGETGAKGDKGDTGDAVTQDVTITAIGSGVAQIAIAGDHRNVHCNLVYDDLANPPAPVIGILSLRYTGLATIFYLTATTVDTKYKLHMISYS